MSSKKKNDSATQEKAFSVDECANVISAFLAERKYEKAVCTGELSQDETLIVWNVPCDTVVIVIGILTPRSEDPGFLARATVACLPETSILPFYRRCLELNSSLGDTTLGAEGKEIAMTTHRYFSTLSPAEVYYRLAVIFQQAPEVAQKLQSEFNVALPSSP